MHEPYLMLIEDNKDDCEAIIRGFKANDCHYPIKWFLNSMDALDHLMSKDAPLPSLIFLDLNMPGMDGRNFLKTIKSYQNLKIIPVIILTTSSDQKDITSSYAHGANAYVQKPIRFSRMKYICKNILEYWFETCLLPKEMGVIVQGMSGEYS